jgi:hypothetical protein
VALAVPTLEIEGVCSAAGELWTSLSRFPDGTGSFGWCSPSTPEELNGSARAGDSR